MERGNQGTAYALLSKEEKLSQGIHQDPIIELVDEFLHEAITREASDIHLQPQEHLLLVRYRIDGVLYDQYDIPLTQAPLIISRLKVLASLDIAQRRIPQDGRFKAQTSTSSFLDERTLIDFRISTFPTIYGEKMVVRILDRSLRLLSLDALDLDEALHKQLLSLIQHPHGLFLVTGPTGCGKTTMLYALISALNARSTNIVTIEDPVEYELEGITQSQVHAKAGFSFENGLRAILRQDPDVIMIGEIRDKQTAHIAIEAALTGHLVVSTLHTNDAPSAIIRLIDMGIEPFLISATLVGVLAQRLARRLCPSCKQQLLVDEKTLPGATRYGLDNKTIYVPQGCSECHHIGFKRRIGIFQLLSINNNLRTLIVTKASGNAIQQEALNTGMHSLFQNGIDKVMQGKTSIEEVLPFILETYK